MRKMSFSIESTRYCNYSKTDKFGEMKFVLPPWINIPEGHVFPQCGYTGDPKYININDGSPENDDYGGTYNINGEYCDLGKSVWRFISNLIDIEKTYNLLVNSYWQPQQAAEILPQCTAADVVMSGYDSDWSFVFRLRSDIAETGKPHPLVEELMTPLRETFKEKGWTNV